MQKEIISNWLWGLPQGTDVYIDDGGLCLMAVGSNAYLEVGGHTPDEPEDHWSTPNGCHEDCPACVRTPPEPKRCSTSLCGGIAAYERHMPESWPNSCGAPTRERKCKTCFDRNGHGRPYNNDLTRWKPWENL